MNKKMHYTQEQLDYLRLLAKEYPNEQAVATEIINLNAIMNLPKGTEHFMSDLHGEYEAFTQIMRSASGAIREKVDDLFSDKLNSEQCAELATLIYYPREKMKLILPTVSDQTAWYRQYLTYLLDLTHYVSSKYTRSKVRKNLPKEYAYVIEELLYTDSNFRNGQDYYDNILGTIIELGKAQDFIVALCNIINSLIVDRLHIIGDIFDRGPRADIIMDELMECHSIDIQWGNHDIIWMGAAAGSPVCIMTVLSNSIIYNNLHVIENGYGISLRPLHIFAKENYPLTDLSCFATRIVDEKERETVKQKDLENTARMSKAVTILLFKLQGQVIKRNPDFQMNDRCMLDYIDYDKGTITLNDKTYPLQDCDFPTVDINDPYHITDDEQDLINELVEAFTGSEKLQKHILFLLSHGSMYSTYNGNLLFHGGIPMNADGTFKKVTFQGETYSGKSLCDYCDQRVRDGFYAPQGTLERLRGQDFMWYLWCGPSSPLFARNKITTFERRLIRDQSTWEEKKDPYYEFILKEEGVDTLLKEFGLDGRFSHVINGHVPVKVKDGESPIKGGGKLFVIDGGFSKAYQKSTGIAGYTLIYNSWVMKLSAHQPFDGKDAAIRSNTDIASLEVCTERAERRVLIAETDTGKDIQRQIDHLKMLLTAYKQGILLEKR